MKLMGLEIRKQQTIDSLYRDVDDFLSTHGLAAGGVPDDLKRQNVAHSIQMMLKPDKWFDICCVKQCATMCNLIIPSERMDFYQPLHCMHWNEMNPDFRQKVVALLLDDFRDVLNPVSNAVAIVEVSNE